MNLLDIVARQKPPEPWAEGDNIPWNDPGFSRRMLREHLSQEHDLASRRAPVIRQHVEWIHQDLLHGEAGRVLDLGCGPGFYTNALARLGHVAVGIDFSPAAIEYANQTSAQEQLAARHVLGDLRQVPFGSGFDLVMFTYGDFNVLRPDEAEDLLQRARRALVPGGRLLLEPMTLEQVRQAGNAGTSWYSSKGGLFLDRPHLCLEESFWDDDSRIATVRYYVLDASSGETDRWALSYQGYSEEQLSRLLAANGFGQVRFYTGLGEAPQEGFFAVTAVRD